MEVADGAQSWGFAVCRPLLSCAGHTALGGDLSISGSRPLSLRIDKS